MIKILALQAHPEGTAVLKFQEEIRVIEESFEVNGVDLDIKSVGAVKKEELTYLLEKYKPEIVHFSGHGSKYGEIYFEDKNGASSPMSTSDLESVFEKFSGIKCVVLNACYSDIQAKALSKHLPYVIGMSNPIYDKAAIVFSRMLYSVLSLGGSIGRAFDLAKNEVILNVKHDESEPMFYINDAFSAKSKMLSFIPSICAVFLMKKGKPMIEEGNYCLRIYIRNYSSRIKKVVYQFDEETIRFEEQFDESYIKKNDFSCDKLAVYGDIIIRATLWNTDDKGFGITSSLKDALHEHYEKPMDPLIGKAIQEISDN